MYPTLVKAPITEAVIDVRVLFDSKPSIDQFARIADAIKTDYPICDSLQHIEMRFKVDDRTTETDSTIAAHLFRSSDKLQVIHSRVDGFGFSRLNPYIDWNSFASEAERVWRIYRDMFKPKKVFRIATRFINRLDLPGPGLDFDDYLSTAPRLPQNVPQHLSAFATMIRIPEIRPNITAVVRQKYEPSAGVPDIVPVILDIDVLHDCDLDPFDDGKLWARTHELREVKNDVFFGSLTKKCIGVFE